MFDCIEVFYNQRRRHFMLQIDPAACEPTTVRREKVRRDNMTIVNHEYRANARAA